MNEKTDKRIRIVAKHDADDIPEAARPKRDFSNIRRIPCGGGHRIIRKPIPNR